MNIRFGMMALFLVVLHAPCLGLSVASMQKLNCAVEEVLNCRFERAQAVADSLEESGAGGLFKKMLDLSIIGMRRLDYDLQDDIDAFDSAFKKARSYYDDDAKKNGPSSDLLTAQGFSYMIAAAYNLHDKNYLSGIGLGFKALSFCREGKKIDSSDSDVDLVLGLYSYARADLRKKFWGMIFWYPGDKLVGIKTIETVAKNGRFTSLLAQAVLQEIYIKEGQFDKASEGLDRLSALYPQSRFLLWSKVKLYQSLKRPLQCAETYSRLAASYAPIPEAHRNYHQTLWFAAQQYCKAGNDREARESCRELMDDCRGNADGYCDAARNLLENLKRHR
jgi:tetratricopeptide (TPR) repeat protein